MDPAPTYTQPMGEGQQNGIHPTPQAAVYTSDKGPQPQYVQHQAPFQQGLPQQGVPHPQQGRNTYASSTPLPSLQKMPAVVDCPVCGVREMTVTQYVAGGMTHLWAALLCFCCCLGCIPYMVNGLKDVEQKCGNCGAILAVCKQSGTTEVIPHAR